MVSVNQIQTGLRAYLDKELMPQLHMDPWKQVAIGTAASIAVQRAGTLIDSYKNNQILKAMNIFDQSGNIDIDIIASELKKNIPETGVEFQVPILGGMKIYKTDVDSLYRMIAGGMIQ